MFQKIKQSLSFKFGIFLVDLVIVFLRFPEVLNFVIALFLLDFSVVLFFVSLFPSILKLTCVFNISSLISHALLNKDDFKLTINFLPFTEDPMKFMNDRYNSLIDLTLEEMLESIFNYKLLHVLLKVANVKNDSRWNKLSYEERERVVDVLTSFNVSAQEVIFDKGQVTSGGVRLDEVDNTFQSKKVKGLYFTGELLDVDGICGGFNLGFAFISGYVVGRCLDDHN